MHGTVVGSALLSVTAVVILECFGDTLKSKSFRAKELNKGFQIFESFLAFSLLRIK